MRYCEVWIASGTVKPLKKLISAGEFAVFYCWKFANKLRLARFDLQLFNLYGLLSADAVKLNFRRITVRVAILVIRENNARIGYKAVHVVCPLGRIISKRLSVCYFLAVKESFG